MCDASAFGMFCCPEVTVGAFLGAGLGPGAGHVLLKRPYSPSEL